MKWNEYEQSRRQLNIRLGFVVFGMTLIPSILLTVGVGPVMMLMATITLGVLVGILYPIWWRSKHHPEKDNMEERRLRRRLYVGRPMCVLSFVASAIAWAMGRDLPGGKWIAVSCVVLGFLLVRVTR
jgi:hypothetical protein